MLGGKAFTKENWTILKPSVENPRERMSHRHGG
jgi:hypothetical protein